MKIRDKSNKTRYDNWERSGDLFVTQGDAVDYSQIKAFVLEFASQYRVEAITFDRWNSSALVTELQNEGLPCVGIGQGFASMNPAVRGFEAKLLSDKLRFYKNPVFKWAFSNVVLENNPAGDSKPSKKASREKIDPVIAALMAITKADFDLAEGMAGNYAGITVI